MAQRIITNSVTLEKKSVLWEAMRLLSASKGLRLVWTCDICGMTNATAASATCESCGATGSLSLREDSRPEIHSRA